MTCHDREHVVGARYGPTVRLACTVTPCWIRDAVPLFCAATMMPAADGPALVRLRDLPRVLASWPPAPPDPPLPPVPSPPLPPVALPPVPPDPLPPDPPVEASVPPLPPLEALFPPV